MTAFPWVQLRYVAKTGTGHTPSRSRPELWIGADRCIPWMTLADVGRLRDGKLDEIFDTVEAISPAGVAASSAVVHPAGTVALSRTASVGFSVVMGAPMAVSQDFMTWCPGPLLNGRFLLHFLRASRSRLLGLMHGSTHKTIYMPDLHALKAPLPPLELQGRIVSFLDRECSRIGEALSDLSGLAASAREVPDAVREEAIRCLPDRVPLGRVARTIAGVGFPHDDQGRGSGELPFVKASDLQSASDGRTVLGAANWVDTPVARRLRATVVPSGATLLPKIGAAMLKNTRRLAGLPLVIDNNLTAVTARNPADSLALFEIMHSVDLRAHANPGPVPSLSEGRLRAVRVSWGTRDQLDAAVERIEQGSKQINRVVRDVAALSAGLVEYREALMTEAVTGQLNVSEFSESRMAESLAAVRQGDRPEVLSS